MPQYGWSDEDLYKATQYITEPPDGSGFIEERAETGQSAQSAEIQPGKKLFQEKAVPSCHVIAGMKSQQDFGPDLSAEGAKTVSQLDFGRAKISS